MSKTNTNPVNAVNTEFESVIARAYANYCRALADILDEQQRTISYAFTVFTVSCYKEEEIYKAAIKEVNDLAKSRQNNCAPYWRNRSDSRLHIATGYLPCANGQCPHSSQSRLGLAKYISHDGMSDNTRDSQADSQNNRCQDFCVKQIQAQKEIALSNSNAIIQAAWLELDQQRRLASEKVLLKQQVIYRKLRHIEAQARAIVKELSLDPQIAMQKLRALNS